ncbi:Response regulator receiver [Crocosphaera watsonii WH 0005]|uniref:Response regulator receiver n=1 Tax=Crocosphaera watsonii WH 0005 TaxID=423472 RepID=T2IRQ0_CROWT|nr:response regulator [Crocosphaera watsonii]CCQ55639.1 Response regulator receiver [Crocosphaera watsonii WH 0005]
MSDRPISLLIVDKDPIFRLGLATSLSSNSQWEISSQTDNLKDALNQLSSNTFDLIILDPNLINETLTIETFYQQAQTSQPEIKLCLLSYDLSLQQQEEFKKIGIEGYLNKGTFIENLLENWQRIIQGELIWPTITAGQLSEVKTETTQENWLSKVRKSGLEQINNNLQGLNENIKNRPTSKLDKIFWKGRKRELLTARWLVKQLLPMEVILLSPPASSREKFLRQQ